MTTCEFGSGSGPVEFRMYVSGVTLVVDDLTEIPRRFPHIHAGVFHLGGTTLPFGRKSPWGLTMDGVQGAKAVQLISPDYVIPVHYDDYGVFASPLADFIAEMKLHGMSKRPCRSRVGYRWICIQPAGNETRGAKSGGLTSSVVQSCRVNWKYGVRSTVFHPNRASTGRR
ncbi:MBL fold metallo-hydrolase [Rhodococcus globerulus]|uniref:MBL fold metallo-hydrolase n=1 Tax=Rhodococcus globerulus TaxID=33008 RepID=UPI001111F63E|nr:hypothetical protein [Rhodococcus globerulus]